MADDQKPAPKPRTLKEALSAWRSALHTLSALRTTHAADSQRLRAAREAAIDERDEALRAEKETRAQFDDLKTRLAHAEAELQRMGGYIARVQEDDVVREELVRIGDPEGEQQLVPKRKPTHFSDLRVVNGDFDVTLGMQSGPRFGVYSADADRRSPPKRHWVTY